MIYLLESNAILLVGYLFYHLVLAKDTFFERNRHYLNLTALVALLLPLLELPAVASWELTEPLLTLPTLRAAEETFVLPTLEVGEGAATWSLSLVWLFYLSVVASLLGRLLYQTVQLAGFARRHTARQADGYTLVHTQGKLPTFSFFNYLFWDNTASYTAEEASQIWEHELAHIRGGHSYDLFFSAVLKACFWFNPVVYLHHRALVNQHEFIADRRVCHQGVSRAGYAQLLVHALFQTTPLHVVHNFNQSQLKTRIQMMFKPTTPSAQRWKALLALPLLSLFLFFFACEVPEASNLAEPTNQRNSSEVYETVEQSAAPVGGMNALFTALADNLVYPKDSPGGKVFVQFVITKEGKLTDAKVVRGLDEATDRSVLEAIQALDIAWLPGLQDGMAVNQRMVMPIMFKGSETETTSVTEKSEVPAGDEIFQVVEETAQPVAGMQAFLTEVAKQVKYPESARSANIEGKVFVEFIVDKDGKLHDAKVVRGFDAACDQAALDAFNAVKMAWTPGMQGGVLVKQRMVLPINFKL